MTFWFTRERQGNILSHAAVPYVVVSTERERERGPAWPAAGI